VFKNATKFDAYKKSAANTTLKTTTPTGVTYQCVDYALGATQVYMSAFMVATVMGIFAQ
jgi:hypothetical protein